MALVAFGFFVGVGAIVRTSEKVRVIDLINLTAGGFAIGAAFVICLLSALGKLRLSEDKERLDKQRPTAESPAASLVGKVS
jgi:hypothetical protein